MMGERMTRQTLGRMLGAFVLGCGFVVASADTARSPVSSGATFDRFAARTPATAPGQTATLLPDGRWLFVGGTQQARVSGEVTTSPAAAQSTTLIYPRYNHTTTLLPDGSVAVMGGVGADGKLVAATEIIDLSTGQSARCRRFRSDATCRAYRHITHRWTRTDRGRSWEQRSATVKRGALGSGSLPGAIAAEWTRCRPIPGPRCAFADR